MEDSRAGAEKQKRESDHSLEQTSSKVESLQKQWEKILDFAFGELQLSAAEFWEMRPSDYNRRVNGYWRNHQRHNWEPAREIATMIRNTAPGIRKNQIKKASDIYPLPLVDGLHKPQVIVKPKIWSKEEILALKKLHGIVVKKPGLN